MQYREDKFKVFSTQFQLSSAESKERPGHGGRDTGLSANPSAPGTPPTNNPELRGNVSKVLKHAVGVEEYTDIHSLPKIKFTMEYMRKS